MGAKEKEEILHGGQQARMEEYVNALVEGDLDRMLELFDPKGKVISPLEGTCDPKTFYSRLFEATENSNVRMLQGLIGGLGWSAAHLKYDWTLTDGSRTRFEVMDLFQFDDKGRIKELKIFYDPVRIRKEYETVRDK